MIPYFIRLEQACEFPGPNKFYFFSFVKKSRCINVGTHSCQSSDDEAMPARHFSRGNPGVIEYLRDFVRTTSLPRGDKKKVVGREFTRLLETDNIIITLPWRCDIGGRVRGLLVKFSCANSREKAHVKFASKKTKPPLSIAEENLLVLAN